MNEEEAKNIGVQLRDVLTEEDNPDIVKISMDGSVHPSKFEINYIDSDKEISTIETRLPSPFKDEEKEGVMAKTERIIEEVTTK